MIRVLLVDDDPRVRRGWQMRLALEPDIAVVGEADDPAESVGLTIALRPDVVLMDLKSTTKNSLDALQQIRVNVPDCTIIVTSVYDSAANRRRALAAGAAAFVSKQKPFEALMQAIRKIRT